MNIWKASTFALALALGCTIASNHLVNVAFADAQPKMQEALVALQTALASLQAATDDKGGHKVKAMKHIKDAIEQVEKGIAFDNKTDGGKHENKK